MKRKAFWKKRISILIALALLVMNLTPFAQSTGANAAGTSGAYEDVSMDTNAAPVVLELSEDIENSEYVVFSMNVKGYGTRNPETCIASGVGITTKGTTLKDMYGFLMAFDHPDYEYFVSINEANTAGFDWENWYHYAQYGNHKTSSKLDKIFSVEGLDIKLVRLGRTAFLLAKYDKSWEQIGYIVLPDGMKTELNFFNLNNKTIYRNISVQNGKEAAIAALQSFNVDVDSEFSQYQYMVGDTSWSVEMKIKDKTPQVDETGDVVRISSLTGAANDPWKEWMVLENQGEYRSLHYEQRPLYGQTFWDTVNSTAGDYISALKEDGLYVKFVRDEKNLYLLFSTDGKNYSIVEKVVSHGLTPDIGLFSIDLNDKYSYKNISINVGKNATLDALLKNITVDANGLPVVLGFSDEVKNSEYAVFTMNVKGHGTRVPGNCIASGVGIGTKGNTTNDMYGFLMAFDHPAYEYFVSINAGNTSGFDWQNWYHYAQYGNHNTSSKMNRIFESEGLDIKLVRLGRTAFLLARYDDAWEQIGYIVLPEGMKTELNFFNLSNKTSYRNITVQTGKDVAIDALQDLTIDVNWEFSQYQYMVGDTSWSVEMKIKDKTPTVDETGDVARIDSLTGVASDPWKEWLVLENQGGYRSLHYEQRPLYGQTFWDTVNSTAGDYIAALKGNGLYARFVRNGSNLYLLLSTDGKNYTVVENVVSHGLTPDVGLISIDLNDKYFYENLSVNVGEDAALKALINKVTLKSDPVKTEYIEGESFDPTGLTLNVSYLGGKISDKVIEADKCTFSEDVLGLNTNKVTVFYCGYNVDVDISVREKAVAEINIISNPSKTLYKLNDSFGVTGGKISVKYDNGTHEDFNMEESMCTDFDLSVSGKQNVNVSYTKGGVTKSTSYEILVTDAKVTDIRFAISPTVTSYKMGDAFVADGVVSITFADGNTFEQKITEDMCSGYDMNVAGTQKVSVTIRNNAVTYQIYIAEKAAFEIAIKSLPEKITYRLGQNLDMTGAVIHVTYNDMTEEDVKVLNEFVTGFNNTRIGRNDVTITYGGKIVSFPLNMKANGYQGNGDVFENENFDNNDVKNHNSGEGNILAPAMGDNSILTGLLVLFIMSGVLSVCIVVKKRKRKA